jgi:DNA-binding MarR family transcriptional regulator
MKDILDSHRSLRILEEISKGDELTQRDLSVRLDMALGLVNTYLKTLVKKGCIKIAGIPPKRFKYYITPKGFIEKSRLTYDLLGNYTRIFREARRDYARLFQGLHQAGVKEVYFAGVDDLAEIAYLSLKEAGIEFLGAADLDKNGEQFMRTHVLSFEELPADGSAHVVVTTLTRRDQVMARLVEAGIPGDRVHGI